MRLRNMLKICLAFCKSEPQYAYKCFAHKRASNLYIGAMLKETISYINY